MSVQQASIAFAGLAALPPAGTHCFRRRRPKLLPEAVQTLGEKAEAYMEERGIPALYDPREGARLLSTLPCQAENCLLPSSAALPGRRPPCVCVRARTRVCVRVRAHSCVLACLLVRACVRARARARACVCVCLCVCVCVCQAEDRSLLDQAVLQLRAADAVLDGLRRRLVSPISCL